MNNVFIHFLNKENLNVFSFYFSKLNTRLSQSANKACVQTTILLFS